MFSGKRERNIRISIKFYILILFKMFIKLLVNLFIIVNFCLKRNTKLQRKIQF